MPLPVIDVAFQNYGLLGLSILTFGYAVYKVGVYLIDQSMQRLDVLAKSIENSTEKQHLIAQENSKQMRLLVRTMTELAVTICDAMPNMRASDLDFSYIHEDSKKEENR